MKKMSTNTLCNINKYKIIFLFLFITLTIAGSYYVVRTWNKNMSKLSRRALDLAETAEAGLPKDYLYALEMNEDDLSKLEYNHLKRSLMRFVNLNSNIRFAYIYKKINSKFYFMVDSELPTSKDYSPPGQEYTEAEEYDLYPYIYEKAVITKPFTDRWGTWISVLVPMKDNETGEILAVFGIDYPAKEWLGYVKERTFEAATLIVCFILLLSALYSILVRNIKLRIQQKQMSILINELEQVKNTLDRAQSIAHVGNWELVLENNLITASQEAFQIYGLKATLNNKISFEEVKRIPIAAERERLDLALKNLIEGKDKYELEYRIQRADTGEIRVIHSNAVLELDSKGQPYRVIGVIWDITEHKKSEAKLRENEELFRTLFEQSPVGITFGSFRGEMFEVNHFFQKMVGRSKEELHHIKWESITHEEDIQKDKELFEKLAKGEISRYTMEKRYIKPDGSIVWANITIAPIYLNNKEGITHLCIAEDITERIQKEKEYKESERSKLVLLSNIPGMAYRCVNDSIYNLQFVSDACYELTGYRTEELLKNNSYSELIVPEYKEHLTKQWIWALKNRTVFCEEYPIFHASGDIVWVFEQGRGVYDPTGNIEAIEGLIINITDRKIKEREIQYLNEHDYLTGLFNRRYLEAMKSKLNKEEALPLTVMIGDINGVKFINDALGHTEGDKLIYQTAKILRECCRSEDIVARTGGDEFSFLLPNAGNEIAITILGKIKAACEKYNNNITNEAHYINISLGYFTITNENQDIDEAFKIAEDYMYKHKLLEHKSSHSVIISSIKATMFARSQETEEHAGRLIYLSKKIGEYLKLSQNELDELELLSTLHDIGKVGINDRILNKEGALTEEEWIEMKKHPEIGYRIAMASPELASIAEFILCHHEQWDGNGYPQGLKGEEIPLLSRIIAVVDAYDAMTQDRIYRKALPKEIAIDEILKNAGKQFDEKIVDVFVRQVLNPLNMIPSSDE